jgi:predicted metal-dependent phosphoesterase TrpH
VRIDLHSHSSASDGTERPGELVAQARRAGLDVVALTDHDTTAGWEEASAAAREHGVALVRGTEVSARSAGMSVHVLSYLHDPSHPGLASELERAREARASRARRIVALLGGDFGLRWEEVEAQVEPGAVIGRPHIADALVARGVVASRDEAFADLLHAGSPYYVQHYAPEVLDAVMLIREAGGVAVFAHPGAEVRGRIVGDAVIEAMVASGLQGLEVDHRDHSPEQRERLRGLAARHGLFVTGSSDYHGTGKENRLGENLTAPEVLEQIVAAGTLEVVR